MAKRKVNHTDIEKLSSIYDELVQKHGKISSTFFVLKAKNNMNVDPSIITSFILEKAILNEEEK